MKIKEIQAKAILTRNKSPEYWFGVDQTINMYKGCQHGCIYCDSRSRCYHIDHFDDEIIVKVNGPELLDEALSKKRHKMTIGSGAMSDCYMPIEKSYELMKQSLEIIEKYHMRCHIATKSKLILRDIDLIEKISRRYANVAITITTSDDALSKIIEPQAASSTDRFDVIRQLRDRNIIAGILLQPQLPYLMEDRQHIEGIIEGAVKSDASFIIPAFGMTLRDGNREYYYKKLMDYDPEIVDKYIKRYGNQYGVGIVNSKKMKPYFTQLCKANNISTKMPIYKESDKGDQMSLF